MNYLDDDYIEDEYSLKQIIDEVKNCRQLENYKLITEDTDKNVLTFCTKYDNGANIICMYMVLNFTNKFDTNHLYFTSYVEYLGHRNYFLIEAEIFSLKYNMFETQLQSFIDYTNKKFSELQYVEIKFNEDW